MRRKSSGEHQTAQGFVAHTKTRPTDTYGVEATGHHGLCRSESGMLWECEFEASLAYRESSRRARAIQRNPVSKTPNPKNKPTNQTNKQNKTNKKKPGKVSFGLCMA